MKSFTIVCTITLLLTSALSIHAVDNYEEALKIPGIIGTACKEDGITDDQVEWEALLDAMEETRKVALKHPSVNSYNRDAYEAAGVEVNRYIDKKWYKDSSGRRCLAVGVDAVLTPRQEQSVYRSLRGESAHNIQVKLSAKNDINPDKEGKAFPVSVHVYQLSQRNAFNNADMKTLFMSPEGELGSSFVAKKDITIKPLKTTELSLDRKLNTQYLGIVAFYKKPKGTNWKKVVSIGSEKNAVISQVNIQLSKTIVTVNVKKSTIKYKQPGHSQKYQKKPEHSQKQSYLSTQSLREKKTIKGEVSISVIDSTNQRIKVEIWTDKKEYFAGEYATIYLKPRKDCYAYVVYEDVEGNLIQLLPNQYRQNNFLKGGQKYSLPGRNDKFRLKISPPFGVETIYLYGSTSPLGDNIDSQPLDAGYSLIKTNLNNARSTMMRGIKNRGIQVVRSDSSTDCSKLDLTQSRGIQIEPATGNITGKINHSVYINCGAVAEYFMVNTHIRTNP